MRILALITTALALALPAGLTAQSQPPPPSGSTSTTPAEPIPPTLTAVTPVMGQSRLTGDQIASWFAKQGVAPAITVPIPELARIFVDEGNAQNIRGDIAFAQSILETGWFRYQGSMVRPADNNYAGLGACDSCSRGNIFETPAEGVRAQIQHLWAYADPNASVTRLARPLADRRFTMVTPFGKAPTWEAMGNGNWASGGGYTQKILTLYASMLRHNGLKPQSATRMVASGTPTGPLPVLVTRAGAVRLGSLRGAVGTISAAMASFGPKGTRRASYGTCRVTWPSLGALMAFAPSGSGTCGDDARVRAAILSSSQWVTSKGLKPGDSLARLRKLYGARIGARSGTVLLVKGARGARLTARIGEGVVKSLAVAIPAAR